MVCLVQFITQRVSGVMIRGQEVISNLLCSSYLKDRRGTTVNQIYAARIFGLPTVIWGSSDFHFTLLCISSTDSRRHRQIEVTVQRGVDSSYSFLFRHLGFQIRPYRHFRKSAPLRIYSFMLVRTTVREYSLLASSTQLKGKHTSSAKRVYISRLYKID